MRERLTINEFGKRKNMDPSSIYKAIWNGRLKAVKIRGRWFISEQTAENFKKYNKQSLKEVKIAHAN